jgi:fucose permease
MKKSSGGALIALSFIAFISLGMPDGLHGVAWPSIRQTFDLSIDAIGLLMIFGTIGYSLSGFLNGVLVRRLGVGGLLALSCAMTSSALLVYSLTPLWVFFVAAAVLGGLGAGAIDAGINTYVAQNHSERMMQWLHGSFGIGVTMGPLIMTFGLGLTGEWRLGYLVVCIFQGSLALVFFMTRSRWKGKAEIDVRDAQNEDKPEDKRRNEASLGETLKNPAALLSMIMFFTYTGAEVGLGLWSYSLLTESRGVSPQLAGFITGSYWGMFTLGRFTAGWYTKRFSNSQILYFSLAAAIAGTVLLFLNWGIPGSIAGIALTGLAIAPVFPCLMTDTESRVGPRHTANTIGMQISAAGIGAAAVPSIAGVLARFFGLEVISPYLFGAFVLLLLSYIFSRRIRKS